MDLEANLRETASLRHDAQACSRQFQLLSKVEETQSVSPDEEDAFWATRQSADFNLWCAKIGVESEGHRSIDVRLKDVPEICQLLLGLLQSLNRDLDQLRHQYNGLNTQAVVPEEIYDDLSESSSISFDSLSSSEGSIPQEGGSDAVPSRRKVKLELKRHIADTMDRLQAQAIRIERAGAEHRRKRVEEYREKERPKQIFEGYKKLGLWKAKEQFKLASEVVKERMAESFARRRIRFEYLSNHQKKRSVNMQTVPEKALAPLPLDQETHEEVVGIPKNAITRMPNDPNAHIQPDQRTMFSATVNTQYKFLPEPKTKERAESVRSIALPHTGFPPPPQVHLGRFQCPYCLLEFREAEASKDRWKQHVMQDFGPYFCTFNGCKTPFEVPNSFDGLLDHMHNHLPMRHHFDEPGGRHREYVEADFERHINSHGEVSDEAMTALKEASRRRGAFLFESCPFCGGYPDDLEKRFPDRDTVDAQKELRKHIKQHMQEIALFLPPYRSDIFGDDDDHQKASDITQRRSNHDKISEDPNDFKKICGQMNCDCRDSSKDSGRSATADETLAQADVLGENSFTIKSRWICCQCGRDYRDTIASSRCVRCESHEKCQSCLSYEYDSSRDGEWPVLLQDFTIYNRAETTDMELLEDDRLHPFIIRYAVRILDIDEQELDWWPDSKQIAKLLRLAKKVGEGRQLRFDGSLVVVLQLLEHLNAWPALTPNSPNQKELLVAALDGDLKSVRNILHMNDRQNEVNIKDIRRSNGAPLLTDVHEEERTSAFYMDVPI